MNTQSAAAMNRISPAPGFPSIFGAVGSVLRNLKSGTVARTASLLAVALLISPFTAMAADPPALFRHVVIFGFKEGTPAAKIDEIAAAFKELKSKIPSVKSFEWGLNVSPENMNPELTHVFTLTFADKESLEKTYLHNPEHLKFVALVKPHIAKAVVVDYVAK